MPLGATTRLRYIVDRLTSGENVEKSHITRAIDDIRREANRESHTADLAKMVLIEINKIQDPNQNKILTLLLLNNLTYLSRCAFIALKRKQVDSFRMKRL